MTESVRFRVTPELKKRWDAMLRERKLTQQDAACGLFAWACEQDPMLQAIIFGQVPERDKGDVAKIVLKRLVAGGTGRGGREG